MVFLDAVVSYMVFVMLVAAGLLGLALAVLAVLQHVLAHE